MMSRSIPGLLRSGRPRGAEPRRLAQTSVFGMDDQGISPNFPSSAHLLQKGGGNYHSTQWYGREERKEKEEGGGAGRGGVKDGSSTVD